LCYCEDSILVVCGHMSSHGLPVDINIIEKHNMKHAKFPTSKRANHHHQCKDYECLLCAQLFACA
jgi:hypothetical protein